MTYDVQRYTYGVGTQRFWEDNFGKYVLAADAEAHEREALEQMAKRIVNLADMQAVVAAEMGRDQAIRDCVAAVEGLQRDYTPASDAEWVRLDQVLAALRTMLDMP